MLLPFLNKSGLSFDDFVEKVCKARNITHDESFELLRKKKFCVITDEEMAQLSRYQFKKDVNITDHEDSVLTSQFLKIYLQQGLYIKRLQQLLPREYSNEGQTQKLIVIHTFFQNILKRKMQFLEENEENPLSFSIKSTAQKTKVNAAHVRMNAS